VLKQLWLRFFFQAEDGIRDFHVTGVQTCALPICAVGGWTLSRGADSPLLLSARNDAEGNHLAVGYHLDGRQAFATPVSERCHDVVQHPYLPLTVFVGRRPSRESYLIDIRDVTLLQTIASPAQRHFYCHGVVPRDGDWFYSTENDTSDPGRGDRSGAARD